MQISLEQQIADYRQMVETTRQDGRALRHRLEKEGWTIIDSLLELGCIPCAIHPALWSSLCLSEDIVFDDEEGFYRLDRNLLDEEQKQIVELPVMN